MAEYAAIVIIAHTVFPIVYSHQGNKSLQSGFERICIIRVAMELLRRRFVFYLDAILKLHLSPLM